MLCVRAPKLEKQLKELAQVTGKTKSHFVRVALEWLLKNQNEDEDVRKGFPYLYVEEENNSISV